MPNTLPCKYCGTYNTDTEYCESCRLTHLENLLFKLRRALKRSHTLCPKIAKEITQETFYPHKSFHRVRVEAEKIQWKEGPSELLKGCQRELAETDPEPRFDPKPHYLI